MLATSLCLLQPFSSTPFNIKSNVNVARNAYDPQGNPWFGKSLNSVDFPNWGHPHQVSASCLPSRCLVAIDPSQTPEKAHLAISMLLCMVQSTHVSHIHTYIYIGLTL